MSVSPLTIKMALAYHSSAEPEQFFPPQTWSSDPAKDARSWLCGNGLLTLSDGGNYVPTQRLTAWVGFICSTPLPVQEWVQPEREDDAAP